MSPLASGRETKDAERLFLRPGRESDRIGVIQKNELKEEPNMANAERDCIVKKVKEVIAAPSCCKELKDAAQKYLDALDTPDEKTAGKLLIAELEEDVQSLDDTMEFLYSDAAKDILGAEAVASMVETGKKVKAAGGKICFCPACTAGQAILEKKEVLLQG